MFNGRRIAHLYRYRITGHTAASRLFLVFVIWCIVVYRLGVYSKLLFIWHRDDAHSTHQQAAADVLDLLRLTAVTRINTHMLLLAKRIRSLRIRKRKNTFTVGYIQLFAEYLHHGGDTRQKAVC